MHASNYMSRATMVSADTPYSTALRVMQEQGLEHVAVIDAENSLLGVVSLHQAELVAHMFQTATVEVRDLIQDEVFAVAADAPLSQVAEQMLEHRAKVVVVFNHEHRPIGMLTDNDLHRALIDITHGEPVKASVNHYAA